MNFKSLLDWTRLPLVCEKIKSEVEIWNFWTWTVRFEPGDRPRVETRMRRKWEMSRTTDSLSWLTFWNRHPLRYRLAHLKNFKWIAVIDLWVIYHESFWSDPNTWVLSTVMQLPQWTKFLTVLYQSQLRLVNWHAPWVVTSLKTSYLLVVKK